MIPFIILDLIALALLEYESLDGEEMTWVIDGKDLSVLHEQRLLEENERGAVAESEQEEIPEEPAIVVEAANDVPDPEPEPESGACQAYVVATTATTFGDCKCGFAKADPSAAALGPLVSRPGVEGEISAKGRDSAQRGQKDMSMTAVVRRIANADEKRFTSGKVFTDLSELEGA